MNRSRKTFKGVSRQVSALALAGMMSFGSLGLGSVYATDIDATKTSSGSTPAYLSITNEVAQELGMGLTVSIPNEMNLTYDSDASEFKTSAKVSAKGILGVDEKLKITTDTSVNYKNEDKESVTAAGTIKFGTSGVETYTADQAYESLSILDERDISATVPKANIKYKGTYKANINFNIEVSQIEYFNGWDTTDFGGGIELGALTEEGLAKLTADNGVLTIPETFRNKSVVSITTRAYTNSGTGTPIKELIIPSSVKNIGANAFSECNEIQTVTIQSVDMKFNYRVQHSPDGGQVIIDNGGNGGLESTALTTINYAGTQEQWTAKKFKKASSQTQTITVHCTDGDITL